MPHQNLPIEKALRKRETQMGSQKTIAKRPAAAAVNYWSSLYAIKIE
jgi:hypothetical protein